MDHDFHVHVHFYIYLECKNMQKLIAPRGLGKVAVLKVHIFASGNLCVFYALSSRSPLLYGVIGCLFGSYS